MLLLWKILYTWTNLFKKKTRTLYIFYYFLIFLLALE